MKKGVLFAVFLLSISILASSVLAYTTSKTLQMDLTEGVELAANNIYLDCAGHSITGTGTGNGVYINGRQNITIKNCNINYFIDDILITGSSNVSLISNNITSAVWEGVAVKNSKNISIISNRIANNKAYGITLEITSNSIISGNIVENNTGGGVYFQAGSKNFIYHNTIVGNNNKGIFVYTSDDNRLDSNIIKNNDIGIYIWGETDRNIMVSNIIRDNDVGIDIVNKGTGSDTFYPRDNVIYNNLFKNNQNRARDEGHRTKWNIPVDTNIKCEGGSADMGAGIIEQIPSSPNIVGGRCWGGNFWSDYTGVESGIENYGIGDTEDIPHHGDYYPLVGIDCGSNIVQNTTLNRDLECEGNILTITADNAVLDCAGHSITGNGSGNGVSAVSRNNVTIENCSISNFANGIYLQGTSESNLISNNIYNSSIGIYLERGSNNTLTSNLLVSNKNYGVTIINSFNNIVNGNTAKNTTWYGFYVRQNSYNNIFDSNLLINNNISGIWFADNSSYNKIMNNVITGSIYGLVLQPTALTSSYNLIYNNFFDNTINVVGHGTNYWNTTRTLGTNIIDGPYLGGNYWSDYNGLDNGNSGRTPGDGIGDTLLPYNESGNITHGGDYAPLVPAGAIICSSVNCKLYNRSQTDCLGSGCCNWNQSAIINHTLGWHETSCNPSHCGGGTVMTNCESNTTGFWLWATTTHREVCTDYSNTCTAPIVDCSSVNCGGGGFTMLSCQASGCCHWNLTAIPPKCENISETPHVYCDKDGIVDTTQGEQCDPGNATVPQNFSLLGGGVATCTSVTGGTGSGTLDCTPQCRYSTAFCFGECRQEDYGAFWTDTQNSSINNCELVFNGVTKRCCPRLVKTSCREVEDQNNNDIHVCLQLGIEKCNDFKSRDDCEGDNFIIAQNTINDINHTIASKCSPNACTPIPTTCTYYDCGCVWSSSRNRCEASSTFKSINPGGTVTTGTNCVWSASEGTCDARGSKTISYSSTDTANCGGNSVNVPCLSATEIPFFNFWSLMVTITGIIVFYTLRKK